MRGDEVAKRGQVMLGASELNVSASGVAEGVFTSVLVPSHCGCSSSEYSKVGSCSLDVSVRCCRV